MGGVAMSEDQGARIEALEMHIAHQDQMLEDLNKVMVDQQAEIDEMRVRMSQALDRIQLVESQMPDEPDAPPPHY
jgi:SlyX protein